MIVMIPPDTNFVVVYQTSGELWSDTHRLSNGLLQIYSDESCEWEESASHHTNFWQCNPSKTRFFIHSSHNTPTEITNVSQTIIHPDRIELVTERPHQ
jgi:hypothetical protein